MKTTTKQFIDKANKVHHNLYGYENTVLAGMNNKVTITCPVHGDFEQRAASHLEGSGCRFCNERQTLTKEIFIERSNAVHGNKYQYDKVKYANVKTKVIINCPSHGNFTQTPQEHLAGYGCPTCGGTKKVTTKEFIKRANKIHDKGHYSYKKTNINGMNVHATVTCSIHGDFEQRPADHLNGVGCPVCGTLKQGGYNEQFFETSPHLKNLPAKLYVIDVKQKYCKVGITSKARIEDRFPRIHFSVAASKEVTLYEAFQREQQILHKYKADRYKIRELKKIKQTGWTECFPISLLPQLIQEIAND